MDEKQMEEPRYGWSGVRARDEQIAPTGEWRAWLLLAGRGFGKTRTGAEWVRSQVWNHGRRRIALVAPTAADARDVIVEEARPPASITDGLKSYDGLADMEPPYWYYPVRQSLAVALTSWKRILPRCGSAIDSSWSYLTASRGSLSSSSAAIPSMTRLPDQSVMRSIQITSPPVDSPPR